MKKTLSLLLSLALVGSLAACGGQTQETPAPTPAPTQEATPTPAPTPETVEVEYRDPDVKAMVAGGANIVCAETYGIYSMEGEAPDSAIKATVYYDLDEDKVVRIDFDEALLPATQGGAEGWALLSEETAAALGEDVVKLEKGIYPMYFSVGGLTWTGAEADGGIRYTAEVEGQEVEFIAYVATQAGGKWYHDAREQGASLLNAAGETVETLSIETKASIEHGVGFWPSPITFPGNIELIKNYVYDNGVNYGYAPDSGDIVKNADGVWTVADTVTGATLAGTPNYFNLIKEAVDQITAGTYTTVE